MQDNHKNDEFEDIFSDSSYSSYDDIDNFPVEVRSRHSSTAQKKNKSQNPYNICYDNCINDFSGGSAIIMKNAIKNLNFYLLITISLSDVW